jgi:hypothetical protein
LFLQQLEALFTRASFNFTTLPLGVVVQVLKGLLEGAEDPCYVSGAENLDLALSGSGCAPRAAGAAGAAGGPVGLVPRLVGQLQLAHETRPMVRSLSSRLTLHLWPAQLVKCATCAAPYRDRPLTPLGRKAQPSGIGSIGTAAHCCGFWCPVLSERGSTRLGATKARVVYTLLLVGAAIDTANDERGDDVSGGDDVCSGGICSGGDTAAERTGGAALIGESSAAVTSPCCRDGLSARFRKEPLLSSLPTDLWVEILRFVRPCELGPAVPGRLPDFEARVLAG